MDKPLWRKVWDFPLVAMLIAMAIMAALFVASGTALAQFGEREGDLARFVPPVLVNVTLAILAMKFVVSRLGETPRDDLPFDDRLRGAWQGTLAAVVLMSVIVGIAALLGGYRIVGVGTGGSWEMLIFAAGFQAGVIEEVLFRGIVFRFLEEFAGSWAALLLSAALFGVMHAGNPNATALSSFAIAIEAGVLLGGAYMLTRNLWLAIGIHFGWNVTQGLVWDVPVSGLDVDGLVQSQATGSDLVSGGAFGLEASVVAMVLATATGVYLVWLAYQRGEVMRPWWVRRRLARQDAGVAAAA